MKILAPGSAAILLLYLLMLAPSSAKGLPGKTPSPEARKIGVLLVNHGSRSEAWRKGLLDLEDRVRGPMLADGKVKGVETAFMEYTEPSIATRLKEFDREGYTDVIVIPVFLTISPHTFDDIPTLIGKKESPSSVQLLKMEKIEHYAPRAETRITPALDFTDLLKKNVLRRVQALSKNPKEEGLVLIAYGDETYEKQWVDLLAAVAENIRKNTGISAWSHGWCGHIAHYDPDKTTAAIENVLATRKTALVIPILVAHDEMFQIKIIGDGIAKVPDNKTRVVYKPDAILPDTNVERWVLDVSAKYALMAQEDGEAKPAQR